MKYLKLNDWEDNGYHDSDFYCAYLDIENGKVSEHMMWTTSFAGRCSCDICKSSHISSKNVEELEVARNWLEDAIYTMIREIEHRNVLAPDDIHRGDVVRLLKPHRNVRKTYDSVDCRKCSGAGKWVNPHNSSDERECFGCMGSGKRKINFAKVKDSGGKLLYDTYPQDLVGTVTWTGTFRTIYSKGFNKLDRSTISTRVEANGREFNAPLSKLRLDHDPMSDKELRDRARNLSTNFNFKPALSAHGGWLSNNWALKAHKEMNNA